MSLVINRISRADQIEESRGEWTRFAGRCRLAAPFCAPSTWIPWLLEFSDLEPTVFELRRDNELLALLPMFQKGRTLGVATEPHLDYQDIAAVDIEAAVSLILELIRLAGEIRVNITFAKVAEHSLLAKALRDPRVAERAYVQSYFRSLCPTVDFTIQSHDNFLASLSRRQRKDYRSATKQIQAAVPDHVVEHYGGRDIELSFIEAVASLHLENQYRKKGNSIFADRSFQSFLEQQIAAGAPICLSMLRERKDGPLMAFTFGYFAEDTYFYYLTAYAGRHANCSPGRWLLVDTLKHWAGATRGNTLRLDLLSGNESYKDRWASSSYEISQFQIIPKRIGNWPRLVAYKALYGSKRARSYMKSQLVKAPRFTR